MDVCRGTQLGAFFFFQMKCFEAALISIRALAWASWYQFIVTLLHTALHLCLCGPVFMLKAVRNNVTMI